MKVDDAKKLVQEHHENEKQKELETIHKRIEQNARLGRNKFNTDFKYEETVTTLRKAGFTVVATSKMADHKEEKYVTYYDVSWMEDV